MSRVELHYGAATDVGQVREVNEDSYLAAPPLFVVADGMGGHEGGDVASRIVVEEFARLAEEGYDPRRGAQAVADTLTACHDRITEYAEEQSRRTGRDFQAGTTAVVALLVEDDEAPKWLLANLGDSRIYRVRRRRARAGQRRPQPGPGARRRGLDHPRGDGRPTRPGTWSPARSAVPTAPTPTTSCSRCLGPSASCSAPTASPR